MKRKNFTESKILSIIRQHVSRTPINGTVFQRAVAKRSYPEHPEFNVN